VEDREGEARANQFSSAFFIAKPLALCYNVYGKQKSVCQE